MAQSDPFPDASLAVLERQWPGARAALKRRILASALDTVNRLGIDGATIELIRADCGASVGNLYHHFGNREGLLAALFFCGLDDQHALQQQYLAAAHGARAGIEAMVFSYVDWISDHPALARFMFQARFVVSQGPQAAVLAQRNRSRYGAALAWLREHSDALGDTPRALLPSLIVGAAENYSRAWLSGRVKESPHTQRRWLAQAAWRSLGLPDDA